MGPTQTGGRRTRAQLKELMIEAGKEIMVKLQPTLGFENLTYGKVFEHLHAEYGEKVTIGSVHERIWPSTRAYQLDVLTAMLRAVPQYAFEMSNSGVLEWFETADLASLTGRRYAAQNVTRLFGNLAWGSGRPIDAIEAIAYDARFKTWTLGADHPESRQISDLVRTNRRTSHDLYHESIRLLMAAIGLRERPHVRGTGSELVSILGNGITVGLLSDPLHMSREARRLPTGLNGELEDWQPSSIGLWAIVRDLLELEGDDLADAERRL